MEARTQNDKDFIPFNRPLTVGSEFDYIKEAIANGRLSGDGVFTRRCQGWLEQRTGCGKALLTHSCTAALEMAALLTVTRPGDEVIMPSFSFVSTANAFALRGAVPVFVDVRSDTLNIDESKVEAAITARTKAIVAVHYAGVACEMDVIMEIAERHGLMVIEDAAQGVMASYRGRHLGGIGHLATLSFHETKNVTCGEGGALLVNQSLRELQAEIIWEKGTNRSQYFRGEIDKYTWVDLGSSYLPSEINAAFLWAQLQNAESISERRMEIWDRYHVGFADLDHQDKLRRPIIPAECGHNAHMYYLLLPDVMYRDALLAHLNASGVNAIFHFIPLHSSPAGQRFGRAHDEMIITEEISNRLLRLPLWADMEVDQVERVISEVHTGVKAGL